MCGRLWTLPRRCGGDLVRTAIAVVFAAAFTVSGSAQDFIAQSGTAAAAFPKPDRPIADIVSPIWHNEKERDDAGEPRQLVRLLGIKAGMTVATSARAAAITSYGCPRSSAPAAALSQRMLCPNICGACAGGCAISGCRTSPSASVSRTIRGCQLIRSTLRSWCNVSRDRTALRATL
jgi:hypothetical protein